MEKEELLKRIQKENKHQDERQKLLDERACAIGFQAMILFACGYYVIHLLMGDETDVAHLYFNGMMIFGSCIYNVVRFVYFRKAYSLFWVALYGFGVIAFFVMMLTGEPLIALWS